MTVTPEHAVQLATDALVARGNAARPYGLERSGMPSVCAYPEEFQLQHLAGPHVYGASMDGCWIVYCDQGDGFVGLRSSYIVAVDRESGSIRYIGSAHDEG